MNETTKTTQINPLTDFGFKRMFGTEQNKDLLIDYLNCSIGDNEGLITDINLLPQEQPGIHAGKKRMFYDIFCKDQDRKHYQLEMQKESQDFFARRVQCKRTKMGIN